MRPLVALRFNRGLSLREAALAIGISRTTLVAAERGDRLYPASAKSISDFYGVKVTDWYMVEPDRSAAA